MIIVSQDKKIISNFENIIGIQINEHIANSDGEKEYEIVVITEKRECVVGVYETEERAKEVLQEMLKQKAMFELYKLAPTGGKVHAEMLDRFAQKNIIFDTYEMPKE